MTSPLRERMEAALADLRAQREKIREFDASVASRKTVMKSKNQMVSATVDSRGKLVELSLKGNRYRTLPPAELASLIVETVAKAQDAALKESLTAAAKLLPDGMRLAGIADGHLDVDRMFDEAIRLAEDPVVAADSAGDAAGG
jgi:DNA-binding protein YbaB